MIDEKNQHPEELDQDSTTQVDNTAEPSAEDTTESAAEETSEPIEEELPLIPDSDDEIPTVVNKEEVEMEEEVDLAELVMSVEEQIKPDSSHDEFNWSVGKRHQMAYSEAETTQLRQNYETSMNQIMASDIISGRVSAIAAGDVVLDVNYKSDGLVALSEFRDMPDLKVGDTVEVYVESPEDSRGQLVLSRRKAKLLRAWERIVDSFKNGTVITGLVISKTKGGLIVDCGGLETFLPGSQIDIKPVVDYDQYVNKTMEFKVVKVNETIKNAVVSHKALIESDLQEQRETIIAGLEKGQVLEGTVKNITDFGAFLDLGGVDGLLYITDISWGRINHPSEVLQLNQKLNVVVLDFDDNKRRISLGFKQLQPHPWDVLGAEIHENAIVKGRVVNIEDYGAFIEIQPGVEGLVHISEVSWSNQAVNAKDFFKLNQEVEAKIVTIDRDERKMSLSIKQMTQDPWNEIEQRFPVGSRYSGTVKNLTQYGVFVELEPGIGGMIHISDLSWTKRYTHPSEFTKPGQSIDVIILDIDKDNRKISLGHKQLEENPWDTFETVFQVGSYHEATVIRKDDRGAIVQLPYGLEAFAPIKHIRKENGTNADLEETITVKVIEFNRDDKRILVSHTRYLEDIRKEAEETVKREKEGEDEQVRKSVKVAQQKVERTTLGDLDQLAALKEQLDEGADKGE